MAVVMPLVPVTAMPYAAARAVDDPNAATQTHEPTRRSSLISGTKIWPAS